MIPMEPGHGREFLVQVGGFAPHSVASGTVDIELPNIVSNGAVEIEHSTRLRIQIRLEEAAPDAILLSAGFSRPDGTAHPTGHCGFLIEAGAINVLRLQIRRLDG